MNTTALPQIYLWHDIQMDQADDIESIGHPHVKGFCEECDGQCKYDEDGFLLEDEEADWD